MVERSRISDQDLSDLIDGRLDPEREAAVRRALGEDPALARHYAVLLEQDSMLRHLGDDILREPVPDSLTEILRKAEPEIGSGAEPDAEAGSAAEPDAEVRPRRWRSSRGPVFAVACALALGLVGGWFGRGSLGKSETGLFDAAVEQAALSHKLFEVSGQPFAQTAGSDVLPVGDLPQLFGTPVRAPVLNGSGWTPVGLRTESGSGGNAVHIAYADADGDRVTLYVRPLSETADDVPTNLVQAEGYDVLYWLDGPLIYALVGDEDGKTLARLARQVYASRAVGGDWSTDRLPATTPPATILQ
ncbi:MAG TPA: hypothetical protein VFZ01_11235 [Geminicoccaceae bacterium]